VSRRRPAGEATVRKATFSLAVLAAAFALFYGAPAAARTDPAQVSLVDQSGANFRIADLTGHPAIITFVATRCTDACPIANAMFSRLQTRLAHDRMRVMLLTITLDPAYDSPFVMGRTAQQYGANARTWRFVSGQAGNVREVMSAFGVVATPDKHGIPEVHSSFVYVLDSHGRLARTLMLSSNLADDATALLRGPHAVR